MGKTATNLALKGLGMVVLALVALSVVATIIGVVVGLITTVISLVVSAAIIGAFILMLLGLLSLLGGKEPARSPTAPSQPTESGWRQWLPTGLTGEADAEVGTDDPTSRLRERYVAGEISEEEFERKLAHILETEDIDARVGGRDTTKREQTTREQTWLRE